MPSVIPEQCIKERGAAYPVHRSFTSPACGLCVCLSVEIDRLAGAVEKAFLARQASRDGVPLRSSRFVVGG